MKGYLKIACALNELGQDYYSYRMISNLESTYAVKLRNERIICRNSKPIVEFPRSFIKTLRNNYLSIAELVKSDSVILDDLLLNRGNVFITHPILIYGNSALFWIHHKRGSSMYLIKVNLIDEKTALIIDLIVTVY